MEIKRRSHHNFCNLDYPLKTRIYWVYNAQHTGFKKFAVCTGIKVTQFIRAQFNFSIQQPPALKVVLIEQEADEVQAASWVSNTNKFGIEMSTNTNHHCG